MDIKIRELSEFNDHQRIIRLDEPNSGLRGFVAIHHRRGSMPCLGATRLWNYETEEEALQDALRLSYRMTYKSALAGLPYGGAKATLMVTEKGLANREELFCLYAQIIDRLDGIFVTGADVGVGQSDLNIMCQNSHFIIGGNVPSGYYTALGVLQGIQVVLEEIYDSSDISGRTFAIQGLGKTGFELFKLLYEEAEKIFVSDINKELLELVKKEYPNVVAVDSSDIHKQKVDVFCPCALSGVVNKKTISQLQCKAIVGAANNQLESNDIGQQLYDANILYAPDYIANSGGLISVADQYKNTTHDDKRIKNSLLKIKDVLGDIFSKSKRDKQSSDVVANQIAEDIFTKS